MSSRSPKAILLVLSLGVLAVPGFAQTPIGPQKPGFPAQVPGVGAVRAGSPTIADLGLTPGHKSIVFGTSGHKLCVVKYDGTIAAGFPVTVPAEIVSNPAVADLDGDGKPDIVVGYGSTFEGTPDPFGGGVIAFRNNGTLLWQRTASDFSGDGIPEGVYSSPAVGDVDGDGRLEVVWGGWDAYIHVVDAATGADKPGWPVWIRDTIWSSPALADIDGDGLKDIIIGVDSHVEGPPVNTPLGGCVYVFRGDATPVPGFPVCADQVIWSSPAVGDIDGDGRPEIVFGTGYYYPGATHKVYAVHCDGSPVLGWPVPVDGQVFTAPALADLDGDGIPEVIVTDDNTGPSATFHVYAFAGSGRQLFKMIPKCYWGITTNAADPIVADVIGDSHPEILFPINTEICVLSSTGVQLTDDGTHKPGAFSMFTETPVTGAVVEDFETDYQTIEIVGVSAVPAQTTTANAKVYVWNPSTIARAVPPWGMFHQNIRHTGVVPGTPSCPGNAVRFYPLPPCRLVDTRLPNGLYGGPALQAQTARTFSLPGNCGIPLTANALSLNVTTADAGSAGALRIYPGTGVPPLASVVNFRPGKNRANNMIAPLRGGLLSVQDDQATATVNLLLDVNGYFK